MRGESEIDRQSGGIGGGRLGGGSEGGGGSGGGSGGGGGTERAGGGNGRNDCAGFGGSEVDAITSRTEHGSSFIMISLGGLRRSNDRMLRLSECGVSGVSVRIAEMTTVGGDSSSRESYAAITIGGESSAARGDTGGGESSARSDTGAGEMASATSESDSTAAVEFEAALAIRSMASAVSRSATATIRAYTERLRSVVSVALS